MSKKTKEVTAKSKSGIGKFFLGALVGAGLGVLFAPQAGSDTRRELKQKIDELMAKAKNIDIDEVKDNITKKVEEIKLELEDLNKEKALKIAKKKANDLKKKCEDLVNFAKKKGTPVLEKAANEVREKTIIVVKEVLEKLEKSDTKAKKSAKNSG